MPASHEVRAVIGWHQRRAPVLTLYMLHLLYLLYMLCLLYRRLPPAARSVVGAMEDSGHVKQFARGDGICLLDQVTSETGHDHSGQNTL